MTKLLKFGEVSEFLPKELREKAKKITSGDLPEHQVHADLVLKFTMIWAKNILAVIRIAVLILVNVTDGSKSGIWYLLSCTKMKKAINHL